MSEIDENKHIVTSCHALNNDVPMPPSEYTGQINTFGFPVTLKHVHKSLKQIINKIPFKDHEDMRTRDMFLTVLAEMEKTDPEVIDAMCERLALNTATSDLLEKRISMLTPADFIVDKDLQTPDFGAVQGMREKLLQGDRQRFAKMDATPGKATTEWVKMDLDEDLSKSPSW